MKNSHSVLQPSALPAPSTTALFCVTKNSGECVRQTTTDTDIFFLERWASDDKEEI